MALKQISQAKQTNMSICRWQLCLHLLPICRPYIFLLLCYICFRLRWFFGNFLSWGWPQHRTGPWKHSGSEGVLHVQQYKNVLTSTTVNHIPRSLCIYFLYRVNSLNCQHNYTLSEKSLLWDLFQNEERKNNGGAPGISTYFKHLRCVFKS